jgi:hypothetical protein
MLLKALWAAAIGGAILLAFLTLCAVVRTM